MIPKKVRYVRLRKLASASCTAFPTRTCGRLVFCLPRDEISFARSTHDQLLLCEVCLLGLLQLASGWPVSAPRRALWTRCPSWNVMLLIRPPFRTQRNLIVLTLLPTA